MLLKVQHLWFELTEKIFFWAYKDELNEGELGWLWDSILTIENILPQQTKFSGHLLERSFFILLSGFSWLFIPAGTLLEALASDPLFLLSTMAKQINKVEWYGVTKNYV